jgi:serine/threonine protein kinase
MPGEPDASHTDLPRLARFEVVRRVGEGGTGVVYEAIDRDRDARVALKMLRVLDPEMLLGLKAEFRALQDIEHPNLIRLFELTCEEASWFFTMELVHGGRFVAYVTGADGARHATWSRTRDVPADHASGERARASSRAPRPADETRLRASLAQLASGLAALHAAGKVHRDIKPSNVLVAGDGRVVILDFGLVRDSTMKASLADDDLVVGTISHMAPEQAAGVDVGPPAD